MMRLRFGWSLVLLLSFAGRLGAQSAAEQSAAAMVAPADAAIARGLEYLARGQQEDGSFGPGMGESPAIVGLSGLAFIASGSTPDRGPYGAHVSKCVDFLVANTQPSGFVCPATGGGHGPMYGHGFATLFLAEVYGISPHPELRDSLSRAVKLIVTTQNSQGGWRYDPVPRDADISVTICQIMALRAARNAGIEVPPETVDRCVEYVRKSQNPDGGFNYQLPFGPAGQVGRSSAFPRSAAGVVALYSAGIYEGDEIERGLAYVERFVPQPGARVTEAHFFYGHYYAVQAMWISGGDRWERWYPAIRDHLVAEQLADGSWNDSVSPYYATAMAELILQLPNNLLPIFQR